MTKIIVELEPAEAQRTIEDDDGRTQLAYIVIMRAIEDVCEIRQIRYIDIYHTGEVE